MGWAASIVLLLAGAADEPYLENRLDLLVESYDAHVRRQSPQDVAHRAAVLREIAHLPWSGAPREEAAAFLARVVGNDRSFRVRAEAVRAIGAVGTAPALEAMYQALFGRAGRSPRWALLYTVVPDALAGLRDREDWDWIRRKVLHPALAKQPTGLRHIAAYRADEMLIVTLEAVGRAGRRELADDLRPFASLEDARVRAAALTALGRLGAGEDLVSSGLRDGDERVRMAAARAASLPWPQLQLALGVEDVAVRRAAIRNLGERAEDLAVPRLIVALGGETSSRAKRDAHAMLVRRTGEDFGLDAQLWSAWHGGTRRRASEDTAAAKRFEAGRVLFVMDVSASMARVAVEGRTMQQQAVEALRELVGRMPRSARFAAIGFASELRRFPDRSNAAPQPADVLVWLAELKPAGASNCYAALMQAIADPFRPDTIVFVSDGVPRHCSWRGNTYGEPEQILHEVREANRRPMVRIHTIGMLGGSPQEDEPVDEEMAVWFLTRLAAESGGTYSSLR